MPAHELNQFATLSDTLSRHLRLERGTDLSNSPMYFYSLSNKGNLKGAYKALREFESGNERGLRLLAASEQVSKSVLSEYSRLNTVKGIDESTVWVSWSIAARGNESIASSENIAKEMFANAMKIIYVLNKVCRQGAYEEIETDLIGLTLEEHGQPYPAACALLGEKAPKQWKSKAMSLLFANERP